ncbi:MAG TPA: hypothetical protein VGH26_10090 [Gaiellaceae bacterium]
MTAAALATAAYGGVLAVAFTRDGSVAAELAPGAALGTLFLLFALARGGVLLGFALWLAGASYVAGIVAAGHAVDATAPVVALLLLLCGELAAWSLDERPWILAGDLLEWRRGAALGGLALAGLVVSALILALSAVPAGHGLFWTALGAAAAVGVAGTAAALAGR